MTSRTVTAPAKLNLGLRITGRRPDGFHEIRSIFQTVSLHDELEISVESGAGRVSLAVAEGAAPEGRENLAARAAELFIQRSSIRSDVAIRLRKRIPMAAGLGGGSSDAAATLRALQTLLEADIDLFSIAVELGSDVPFFLEGGCSRVEGRGEVLSSAPFIPFWAVLLHPPIKVSTAWAYGEWDRRDESLTKVVRQTNLSALEKQWHEGVPFPRDLGNDFLPLLEERHDEISRLTDLLESLDCDWGLSGSGPTLYLLAREEKEARALASRISGEAPVSICRAVKAVGASSNW